MAKRKNPIYKGSRKTKEIDGVNTYDGDTQWSQDSYMPIKGSRPPYSYSYESTARKDRKDGAGRTLETTEFQYTNAQNVSVPMAKILQVLASEIAKANEKKEEIGLALEDDNWNPQLQAFTRFFRRLQHDFNHQDFGAKADQKAATKIKAAITAKAILKVLRSRFKALYLGILQDANVRATQKQQVYAAASDRLTEAFQSKTTTKQADLTAKLSSLSKAYNTLSFWYEGNPPTDAELVELSGAIKEHNKRIENLSNTEEGEQLKEMSIKQEVDRMMEKVSNTRDYMKFVGDVTDQNAKDVWLRALQDMQDAKYADAIDKLTQIKQQTTNSRVSALLDEAQKRYDRQIRKRAFLAQKAGKAYSRTEVNPHLYRLYPEASSLRMTLLKMLLGESVPVYQRGAKGKLEFKPSALLSGRRVFAGDQEIFFPPEDLSSLDTKIIYNFLRKPQSSLGTTYKTYAGRNRNRFNVVTRGETVGPNRTLFDIYSKGKENPTAKDFTKWLIKTWVPILKEFQPTKQFVRMISSKLLQGGELAEGEYDPLLGSTEIATESKPFEDQDAIETSFSNLQTKMTAMLPELFEIILDHKRKIVMNGELGCFYQKEFHDIYEAERNKAENTAGKILDEYLAYQKASGELSEDEALKQMQWFGTGDNPQLLRKAWSYKLMTKYPYLKQIVKSSSEFTRIFIKQELPKDVSEGINIEEYSEPSFTLDKGSFLAAQRVTAGAVSDAKVKLERAYFKYRKYKDFIELKQKLRVLENSFGDSFKQLLKTLQPDYAPVFDKRPPKGTKGDGGVIIREFYSKSPQPIKKLGDIQGVLENMIRDAKRPPPKFGQVGTAVQDMDRQEYDEYVDFYTKRRLEVRKRYEIAYKKYEDLNSRSQSIQDLRASIANYNLSVGIDYKKSYLTALEQFQKLLEWRMEQKSRRSSAFYPKVGENVGVKIGPTPTAFLLGQIIEVDYIRHVAKILPDTQYEEKKKYEDRVLLAPFYLLLDESQLKSRGEPDLGLVEKYEAPKASDEYLITNLVSANMDADVGQYREFIVSDQYTNETSAKNRRIGVEIIVKGPFGTSPRNLDIKKDEVLVAIPKLGVFDYKELYKIKVSDLGPLILTRSQAVMWPQLYNAPPESSSVQSLFGTDLEEPPELSVKHNPHRSSDFNFVTWTLWGSVLNVAMTDILVSEEFRIVADAFEYMSQVAATSVDAFKNQRLSAIRERREMIDEARMKQLTKNQKIRIKNLEEELDSEEDRISAMESLSDIYDPDIFRIVKVIAEEVNSKLNKGSWDKITIEDIVEYLYYLVSSKCMDLFTREIDTIILGDEKRKAVAKVKYEMKQRIAKYQDGMNKLKRLRENRDNAEKRLKQEKLSPNLKKQLTEKVQKLSAEISANEAVASRLSNDIRKKLKEININEAADRFLRDIPFDSRTIFKSLSVQWWKNFKTQNWSGLSCYWKLDSNWRSTKSKRQYRTKSANIQSPIWSNRYEEDLVMLLDKKTLKPIMNDETGEPIYVSRCAVSENDYISRVEFRNNESQKLEILPLPTSSISYSQETRSFESKKQQVSYYDYLTRLLYINRISGDEYSDFHIQRKEKVMYPFKREFGGTQGEGFSSEELKAIQPFFYYPLDIWTVITAAIQIRKAQASKRSIGTSRQDKLTQTPGGQLTDKTATQRKVRRKRGMKKSQRNNPKERTELAPFYTQCVQPLKLAVEHILMNDYFRLVNEYKRK